ncbi:MAG TPA: hypothetical protein VFI91_05525 [Longimicrobiaceae bacterium]|nr:hypothetical protein [Longimicrobiaceae bacterium]
MNISSPLVRLVGVTVLAIASATPLLAQTGAGDEGTFEVFVDGRRVGTEQFTIRQTGVGSNAEAIATGRVELALPTGTLVLLPRLRATGFQADPVAYEITIEGDSPRTIVGTVGDGRFSARIASPSGEQLREYVASSGATILDEGIAHHYYFLARRSRNGRVPILIPRENRQVMATVSDLGEEQVNIGGVSATLFHLLVVPDGGAERHVWVDALNRVIKVEIPDSGYRAVRTEIPR